MWISKDGFIYEGDCQIGDREATLTEIQQYLRARAVPMFTDAIQQRLDDFARTRNYDDIKSAVSYAGDPDPVFSAEGQACRNLRSATWRAAHNILAQVQAGTRPMPQSIADIEADLPALVWPA